MNKVPEPRRAGEERIGRAFKRSLVLIGVAGAIVALFWWLSRSGDATAPVEEAAIEAPVSEAPVEMASAGPPVIPFTDISATAGIDFVHVNGAYGDKLIPETMGSGLAFFDYDNDGLLDVLAVGPASPGWAPRTEYVSGRFWRTQRSMSLHHFL